MSKVPENIRRALRFLIMPSTWAITLASAFLLLFALQSKPPVSLTTGEPRVIEDAARPATRSFTVRPPILIYNGPIIVTIHHTQFKNATELTIFSGGNKISQTEISPGFEGTKQFYFYAEEMDFSTGVIIDFVGEGISSITNPVKLVEFSFPKSGNWLIPFPWLWISVMIIGLIFGLICALIWENPVNVIASYFGSVIMLAMACYFGGLDMTLRIGNQLISVVLLLITVAIVRHVAAKRNPVVVK